MITEPGVLDLAQMVMARCDMLAACTEEPGRITRRYGTPALAQAQELVSDWMRKTGLTVRRDSVGNLLGRWSPLRWHAGADTGRQRPVLLLGGHLDTVRNGGRYDGTLGVLAGLAAVEHLQVSRTRLPFDIEIAAFADEEGTRFHTAYLGSRGFLGALDATTLARTDETGISVAEAIRAFGGDPEQASSGVRPAGDVIGYVEAHIEQGPVLEQQGVPVGVVGAIAGQTRATLTFAGEAGHAGTVPMELRRDALCAAAEFILRVEETARHTAGLVATVGHVTVEPGVSNVIPGTAAVSLDLRHANDATRQEALASLLARARAIGARRRVGVSHDVVHDNASVQCDDRLLQVLEDAITSLGLEPTRLVSGAGHDAVALVGRHAGRDALRPLRGRHQPSSGRGGGGGGCGGRHRGPGAVR
ncbi:MAG: Zn-dependent hydrolase [Thermomicrobiales bacterium]|nr:MAG: Zn-dependent hydrolase [Thermomicrobiales bacterium]